MGSRRFMSLRALIHCRLVNITFSCQNAGGVRTCRMGGGRVALGSMRRVRRPAPAVATELGKIDQIADGNLNRIKQRFHQLWPCILHCNCTFRLGVERGEELATATPNSVAAERERRHIPSRDRHPVRSKIYCLIRVVTEDSRIARAQSSRTSGYSRRPNVSA